jgi:myosin heavy subunit
MGSACKGGHAGIVELVMSTFPILEALGNAKSGCNNNSSRYGKWLQVFVDSRARIIGCTVDSYLLEKSRVVSPNTGERKYPFL